VIHILIYTVLYATILHNCIILDTFAIVHVLHNALIAISYLTLHSFSCLQLSIDYNAILVFAQCSVAKIVPHGFGDKQGGHSSGKPGKVRENRKNQGKVRENELLQLFSCHDYCSDRNMQHFFLLYFSSQSIPHIQ